MGDSSLGLEKSVIRGFLFEAAIKALRKEGWTVERARGMGKGSVRRITRDGKSLLSSIRTTQNQWIAFPRNENNDGWGTLADVDVVVAASVDDRDAPSAANIHFFDAKEVLERFDRAYAARIDAGYTVSAGHGFWLGLYVPDGMVHPPTVVGGGIGLKFPPIAVVPFSDMQGGNELPHIHRNNDTDSGKEVRLTERPAEQPSVVPFTIAEAKRRLAEAFGVSPENVKITIEA